MGFPIGGPESLSVERPTRRCTVTQRIRDVMTADPTTLSEDATVADAAKRMRDDDIGDPLVVREGELTAVITDRDIAVRVVAEDRPPADTPLRDIASKDLARASPDASIADAVRIVRERALRRIPLVEERRPVGIVSIGDLAVERDTQSALADISASEPNQ
jgi:CBS domain-containing protein